MTAAVTLGGLNSLVGTTDALAIPTHRCTECTLMRCHVAGQSCWECGEQAMAKTTVVCCNCGWLMTAGMVTCPGCGGSS